MQVRRVAALTIAALLSAVVSAGAQTISITNIAPDTGNLADTGISNRQTVVSNRYGYFLTYVVNRDNAALYTRWRLVRSVDGGATFNQVLYESCPSVGSPSCPGGGSPAIETDSAGNIYLIYQDPKTGHAYFMRFLAANNYLVPTPVPLYLGDAQKFSAVIDESRGVIYYASVNSIASYPDDNPYSTAWFFTIALDGSSYSRHRLTKPSPGKTNDAHYPHLYLDEHNHLYAAWTTSSGTAVTPYYYSIHFMRSLDGGASWKRLDGTPIPMPAVADEHGWTHEVNPQEERYTHLWLQNMIVKQGKAHFWYRANNLPSKPMHYVRFDLATGARQDTTPVFGGPTYSLNASHGDCSTKRERLDGTIYCVATTAGPNDSLAVVKTMDNGQTWHDYAIKGPNTGCDESCHFWVNTARQITEGSMLLGSYTDDRGLTSVPRTLHFFKVPVPSRPLDYDRDSKADPAFYRPSNGNFAWFNAAIGLEARPLLTPVAGDVPLSGDYDGDGKADPAIFRASTGAYHYAASANNYTPVAIPFTYPNGGDIPLAGDYNGDGKAEPAFYRPSNGCFAWLDPAIGLDSRMFLTPVAGDIPLAGDYDGDGKTDPAIFRYSTGAYHYASSANNYTVVSHPFTYPSGGDIALVGDYNGDGRAEPAFYRPNTGGFAWLDPAIGLDSRMFLTPVAGDIPLAGDYDGDGKTDPAIFRASTGVWHYASSADNYVTVDRPFTYPNGGDIPLGMPIMTP